jgi:hypothetical protein
MKEEGKKDIFFILYILLILAMSTVYFKAPERALFIENKIEWWSELWDILRNVL